MSSESNKSIYSIEKLDGENYVTWSVNMKQVLIHQGIWDHVDETVGIRPTEDKTDPEKNKPYLNWGRNRDKATSSILLNIRDEIKYQVIDPEGTLQQNLNYDTPKKVWERLKTVYGEPGNIASFTIMQKLNDYQFHEGDSYRSQLDELHRYRTEAAKIGFVVTDTHMILNIRKALPHSWQDFKTVYLGSKDKIADLKLTDLTTRIREEEDSRKAPGTSLANFANKRNDKCNFCGKPGHWERDCRKKKAQFHKNKDNRPQHGGKKSYNGKRFKPYKGHSRYKPNRFNNNKSAAQSYVAVAVDSDVDMQNGNDFFYAGVARSDVIEWILDSGNTDHLTPYKSDFDDNRYETFNSKKIILTANGGHMDAVGSGICPFHVKVEGEYKPIEIRRALHVPNASMRLLSVSRLIQEGCRIEFLSNSCLIRKNEKTLAEGTLRNNLYYVRFYEPYEAHSAATQRTPTLETWHRRFVHLNLQSLRALARSDDTYVKGFSIDKRHMDDFNCESCLRGKMTRKPFPLSETKSSRPLELVHSDLMGPMQVESLGKNLYTLTFVDDYSRWTKVYLIPNKK